MELTRRSLELGPIELFGTTINPTIHWYGVIIVIGIVLATSLAAWLAKKDDEDPEIVWNGVVWVVILAVLGARLWSVVFPAGDAGRGVTWNLDYLTDLRDGPLAIWSGGLSIFGAIFGGALGVGLYARRHKLRLLPWADRVAIAMPLGQAIGRWGNFVNQELYGRPSNLPWAIKIDNPIPPYTTETHFHPLFLYESLWSLALCGLLFYLWRNRRQHFQLGDFFLIYIIGYSIARFLLEFIRVEIPKVGDVNASQVITVLMFFGALIVFLARRRTAYFVAEHHSPFGTEPSTPKKKTPAKSSTRKPPPKPATKR